MGKTIDCHFWNPSLDLDDKLEFTYEDVGNSIELKRPVFTKESLSVIINSLKRSKL